MFSVIIQIKVTEIVVFSLGFVKFWYENRGKVSFSLRSGNVRECQGKSGKLAMVRAKQALS